MRKNDEKWISSYSPMWKREDTHKKRVQKKERKRALVEKSEGGKTAGGETTRREYRWVWVGGGGRAAIEARNCSYANPRPHGKKD